MSKNGCFSILAGFVLTFSQLFSQEAVFTNQERFLAAQDHEFKGFDKNVEKEWQGPFFFIQIADCQLGFFEHNISWEKEMIHLEKAVEHINRLRPRFVILCGDITHARPKKPMYEAQVADFKKIMRKVDREIPLVCLCGNHDVGNTPDRSSIEIYESHYGSHYFSFWVGGTQCIALNSSLIWDPSRSPDLYEEQLQWFQSQLRTTNGFLKPIHRFVFTHHPWFLNSYDEDNDYFVIPKTRRLSLLQWMNESRVTACFSGHYHRNAVASYLGMEMITTSALGKPLGKDPSGFRIVKVYRDSIQHQYYSLDEVPEQVSLSETCFYY